MGVFWLNVLIVIGLPLLCEGLSSAGWRIVGRNTSGAWRMRGLRFFADPTCSPASRIEAHAHCDWKSCSAYERSYGTALAGPPSRTAASYALLPGGTGDDWWRSRGPCPDPAGDCYVGFFWRSYQVGLPGVQLGFSVDRGKLDAPRFSRAAEPKTDAVELQCVELEQAAQTSIGGPASELVVQYLVDSTSTWSTIASNLVPAGSGLVQVRVPLA